MMTYPFDKFRRMDFDFAVLGVSQADVTDATRPSSSRTLLHPSATFTRDVTTPGYLYPTDGHRFALRISGSPLSFSRDQIRFLTLLGDARSYASFGRSRYTFALRASGGASLGPQQQLFYSSGVQNWVNRGFDADNGFPILQVTDFVFATPVMPLRGSEINTVNGSYFGLVNAEFRFPLVAALLPGPIPLLPFYNIQGVAFTDVGAIWGGRGDDTRFNVFRNDPELGRVFDNLLVGSGLGLRTILLGYPVRLDWAWPYDGKHFGDRRIYFSIGFDF
jgi:outer membrane protein assembly factor BamA